MSKDAPLWPGVAARREAAIHQPISDQVIEDTTGKYGEGSLERLKQSGYMSPQNSRFTGKGFACANCQWYAPYLHSIGEIIPLNEYMGSCQNPRIHPATVELAGCCDRFTYEGVHTE